MSSFLYRNISVGGAHVLGVSEVGTKGTAAAKPSEEVSYTTWAGRRRPDVPALCVPTDTSVPPLSRASHLPVVLVTLRSSEYSTGPGSTAHTRRKMVVGLCIEVFKSVASLFFFLWWLQGKCGRKGL